MHNATVISTLPLVLAAVALAPSRLNSFEDVLSALKAGNEVKVVVDYSKTLLFLGDDVVPAPKAIGGMKIDSWEWFDRGVVKNEKAYIATSKTVLIAHPSYGTVHNYVRFRIYEDNLVEITARYLATKDYEILMDESFQGKISNGKDEQGISFFVAN